MFHKLLEIQQTADLLSAVDFQLWMNTWNGELEDFMKFAKKKCHKFKSCRIEWNPAVGIWLK